MIYKIKKFNLKKLVPYSNIILIGKKKTGKTSLLKSILYYKHKRLKYTYLISETALITNAFKDIIPKALIFSEFDYNGLKAMINNQKEIRTDLENKGPKSKYHGRKVDIALCFDDILALDGDWKKCPEVKGVFMNGRHYLTDLIIGIQDVMALPPNMRGNTDYVIITKLTDNASKEKFYKNYWNPSFGDKKVYNEVLNFCTEGYRSLMIDMASLNNSSKLEDCIYYIEEPAFEEFPPFHACSKNYWNELTKIEKK